MTLAESVQLSAKQNWSSFSMLPKWRVDLPRYIPSKGLEPSAFSLSSVNKVTSRWPLASSKLGQPLNTEVWAAGNDFEMTLSLRTPGGLLAAFS